MSDSGFDLNSLPPEMAAKLGEQFKKFMDQQHALDAKAQAQMDRANEQVVAAQNRTLETIFGQSLMGDDATSKLPDEYKQMHANLSSVLAANPRLLPIVDRVVRKIIGEINETNNKVLNKFQNDLGIGDPPSPMGNPPQGNPQAPSN